jgi:hypothetical protein
MIWRDATHAVADLKSTGYFFQAVCIHRGKVKCVEEAISVIVDVYDGVGCRHLFVSGIFFP